MLVLHWLLWQKRWFLVVPLLFFPPPGLTQYVQKAKLIPGGALLTDLELYYTKKANWLSVFRYAAYQLWLHRQLPLRFLFKHQLLLVHSWVKYFPFSTERSQEGFGLMRGVCQHRALVHDLIAYLEKWQIRSTVFVSQGIVCRFLAFLLL